MKSRRMSTVMGSIHEGYALGGNDGAGRGGVDGIAPVHVAGMGEILDDYVGDFATTYDTTGYGYYTPTGSEAWASITEGESNTDAQQVAALLSTNPAVRAAALNDAVAAGTITVAQTIPNDFFTVANVGKMVMVGAALYRTVAMKNAQGQVTGYAPVQVAAPGTIFGLTPLMAAALAIGAFLILS